MTRNRIPAFPTGNVSSPGRSLSPASNGVGELSPAPAHTREASPVAAHGEGAYGVITSSPSGAK